MQTIEEANMIQIRSFDLEVVEPRRLERKKDSRDLIRLILKSHQGDTESLAEAPKLRGLAVDHYRALHWGDTRDTAEH
jgi:hypothetical protein